MSDIGEPSAEQVPAPSHSRPIARGVLMGMAVALALVLIAGVLLLRNPTPPLTQGAFDAALARWEAQHCDSYDMDVQLGGRQPGSVHVEVRRGEVTRMTRDGRAPSQRRTWDYWSVPSLFEMIRTDMETAAAAGQPGDDGQRLSLRAEFDARWGYPARYQRHALGIQHSAEWRVTGFVDRRDSGK